MILDHLENLVLPDEEADDHFDARMALARLAGGLYWLNQEVSQIEADLRKEGAVDDIIAGLVGGVLDGKPLALWSCAFQWYAVSACNYAQLVGWLATRDTALAKAYAKRVIPRLLNYRNKVAAHFAITDPRRDNEADLAASVMTHVVYLHGRLCAAALSTAVRSGGQQVTISRDLSWSLTLAHERIVPRYWPQGPPPAYQALRLPPGETKFSISWSDLLGEDASFLDPEE